MTDTLHLTALGQLGHLLVRQQTHDTMDPYFVHGHPAWPRPEDDVCACFYYAVVVGEEFTVLFDNQGMGGMCKMEAWEIAAVWDTQEVLSAMDLARETFYQAATPLSESDLAAAVARLPAPRMDAEALYTSLGQIEDHMPAIRLVEMFERIRRVDRPEADPRQGLPMTEVPLKGATASPAPLRRLRHR